MSQVFNIRKENVCATVGAEVTAVAEALMADEEVWKTNELIPSFLFLFVFSMKTSHRFINHKIIISVDP